MKQFFEQYGGVALGILALLVLIAMITPVGNIIKTSLQGTAQTFSSGMDSQTDGMTDSMAEAIKEASIERYYDDAGNRLNGIVDRTLYVNGVAYQNMWTEEKYSVSETSWGWKEETTSTGYRYELIEDHNFYQPYVYEVAYDFTGYRYTNNLSYKFMMKDGYKYVIYASNPYFSELLYNYFGEDNLALGPVTWTSEGVQGKHYTLNSNKGIIENRFNASYFTLRIGTNGEHEKTVGTVLETDFMIFEVPSDLDVDLSSL